MNRILILLIVAAVLGATNRARNCEAARLADAVEVFSCDFEPKTWDKDYDKWPDLWKRRQGPEYPHYVEIGVSDCEELEDKGDLTAARRESNGEKCLKIKINGGAAVVESPPIPVRSLFSYVMEGSIRLDGLDRDEVYLAVTFFDEDNQRLESATSPRMRGDTKWTDIRIGPLSSEKTTASYAIISLHLVAGERADLSGAVYLDNVWFARLPRLHIKTNSAHNVYTGFNEVEITCEVSGILERDPMLKFEVVDVFSKTIAKDEHRLKGQVVAEKASRASKAFATKVQRQAGFAGTAKWKPQISDYGYYQVRVALYARGEKPGEEKLIDKKKVSFAIVRAGRVPARGEFGWTLPRGDDPVPLAKLEQLVGHVGINWLKFPVWYGAKDTGRADKLVRFSERLSLSQIEIVGLLHRPPPELEQHYGHGAATAADIFASDAQIWTPSLEAVMTRLSLKIRWWQLGLDQDHSFVNYPNLKEKISSIKRDLYKFGQEAYVGIGWRWINEPIDGPDLPWRFLSLSASPELTPDNLEQYLAYDNDPISEQEEKEDDSADEASSADKPLQNMKPLRWVVVEPLPRGQYDQETRATDLIHRMLAAKMGGADGIFVPNPFSTERGLMNDDGTPGELLLPWRTTALSLAGAEYLGSIGMPGGSSNHVFTRDGEAMMVVWNENPTKEVLYLGNAVQTTDIWGRITDIPANNADDHRQTITVGPLPIFVTGVNEPVIRMRMSFRFARERLPSIFGRSHDQGIVMQNFFPVGVNGHVRLNTPSVWKLDERIPIKMARNEKINQPFQIELPFDASTGRQDIRVDFEIEAEDTYRFSVYRHIDIGLGDVVVDVVTSLDKRGDLLVEQHLTNHTDKPLSFTCTLFAPKRRRMRTQVLELERRTDKRTFRLSRGEELVDKTLLLRLEEVDGQRVLNYRVKVNR